ncbi:MAG TPA: hypothetical protein VFS77_23565 [Pyrinomonadaceae bacterium]|nr:hypothetical protein [Pyrinomonadaceae bacterium]
MKKKTSRRTFGKQIAGALAATTLPVGRIISAPVAGAQETQELKSSWNGAERFQAIAPALGTVMNLLVTEEGEYAPVMEAAALSLAARKELDDAISFAASKSGASNDQIITWIDAFTSLGKPGLMADIPLTAADCAANLQGSWELTSRFSGGLPTAARSEIYADMDPVTGRGKQLITMLTEVNFFTDPPVTSFFIGFADVQFTQNGPFEVIGTSVGTTFGNLPGYENGLKTTDQFRLVRRGQNETMLGYPIRTESNGSDTAARTLVEVSGDPGTIKFKMWGSLGTGSHPRTVDTVDTYRNTSNLRPLIGGWEPITDYFERVKANFKEFSASAPTADALQKACDVVAVPRLSR